MVLNTQAHTCTLARAHTIWAGGRCNKMCFNHYPATHIFICLDIKTGLEFKSLLLRNVEDSCDYS